jgi:hypothetical protein
MHRSGSSALARIISFLGAALPRHLVPASESNPRGHWESARLVALHEQLLASIDTTWDDWRAPPLRWRDNDTASKFGGKIQQAIDEEFGNAPLIVLKDPRMCRTLPYWMSVLEKTGIRSAPVIIVRNPLEVAESLRERDGISFEKAMLLWLRHYLDAEYETRHLARNIVSLDVLLEDWRSLFAQTSGRLGIQWPRSVSDASQDVREFLDLELHNHRATMAELEAHTEVPSWVKSAYRALTTLCDEPKAADPKRELDRVRQNFSESAKLFGVVAYAQTDALKQADLDVAEARQRADGADMLRAELSQERAAHADLARKHQSLVQRARTLETELSTVSERATRAEHASAGFESALNQLQHDTADLQTASAQNLRRAEAAEKHASNLIRDIAELERNRNEMSQTLKRMTTDASDLRTMAESVSKRTEWIETELRKQGGQGGKTKADVEEARTKIMSLSGELQGALSNSMSLSRELAAAKEQIHKHEKQAIQIAADAKRYQDALKVAQDKLKELEADERAAQSEIAELRAELAESWALTGGRMGENQPAPSEPVVLIEQTELTDVQARAQRIEEDLRFERMHVQQLERRLNSWTGLASAALRKITRLGGKSPSRRPASPRRLNSTTAASRT